MNFRLVDWRQVETTGRRAKKLALALSERGMIWLPWAGRPRRVGLFAAVLGLLTTFVLASDQEAAPLRRGSWAAFKQETDVLSANDTVIRKAAEGEVVRIRILRGEWAEVGSSLPDLAGGKVAVSALRAADAAENEAWVAKNRERLAQAAQEAAPLETAPTPEEEAKLESDEPPPAPLPQRSGVADAPALREPVIGWFAPGRATRINAMARDGQGAVCMVGVLKQPLQIPGARGWSGPAPGARPEEPEADFAFLARIAPDLRSVSDLIVFAPDEIRVLHRLQVAHSDGGLWAEAEGVGEAVGGKLAPKAPRALVHFAPDVKSVVRCLPLLAGGGGFVVDAADRPIVLHPAKGRSGGAFLARYFSTGHFERMWPEAPDGPVRRLVLDFSSKALAEGPFALWAKKSEALPDFPTPLGPWGSAPNAGQPMVWTNVKSGKNPIRGANLMPEALALDREGNVLVAGTIPFHMGNPDFDPFLLKFTPSGKLLWNNCFLNGLLSEPDQKVQALAVDPSTGDIVVAYWQHGNNVQTLLLDPEGWLTRFTGTNGNIKISWIGRVDAVSGQLKHSTYLYARMPESKNPKWPDLNSVGLSALAVGGNGWVHVAGSTTIALPTTANAFLTSIAEYGGHPFFAVLEPTLSAPRYSTYLSPGQGGVNHLVLASDVLAVVAGTHKTEPPLLPATGVAGFAYLTADPPAGESEASFVALVPVPAEPAPWSFDY